MKVTRRSFDLALRTPFETSGGQIERRDGWVLRVGIDPHGLGEATPLPGFTESADACDSALSSAVSALEADDTPGALLAVSDRPAARHGVATALLDRRAKLNDRPLYRELGGEQTVPSIPVHATVGDADAERTVEKARAAYRDGFRTIKLKVGVGGLERDIERVSAVRSTLGDDVDIRVDANGAWEFQTARRAIDRLAEYHVTMMEQPLAPPALTDHRRLRGRIPIALDESLLARSVEAVIDSEAADVLVLKPMALGGPDVARGIAVRARRAGIDTIVSNTIDAAIARTAAVHLAASLPDRSVSGLATAGLLESDVAQDPAPVSDGRMRVPDEPGLGISEVTLDA